MENSDIDSRTTSPGHGRRLRLPMPIPITVLTLAWTAGLVLVCAGSCSRGEEASIGSASLTVPAPGLSQFAILAARGVTLGDRQVLTGGDVGVAAGVPGAPGSLTVGIDARVGAGEVLLAQVITLRDRSVTGELGATAVNVAAGATTGPRSGYVPPPAAPTPGTFTVGTAAITIASGQTSSLPSGKYGAVTVNGALNLAGGLYEFQSLRVGVDARLTAVGRATVHVLTGLVMADRARVRPGLSLRAGDLRLMLAGAIDGSGNAAVLGTDTQLTALLVARNGFRAADRATVTGALAARDVVFGNDGRVTFETGFGCTSSAQCAAGGGGSCTVAACVDAQCLTSSVPDGSYCDDANACTQGNQCQLGACVGGPPVICPAGNQCREAGTCQSATGLCTNPPRPDGTACDDGEPCSGRDTCLAGACAGGEPLVTEFATGLMAPRALVVGPDANLWFVSPETAAGAADGAVARLTLATGTVTAFVADKRLNDITAAPDGNLWLAETLPAANFGLAALGRITTAGMFLPSLVGLPAERVLGGTGGKVWFTSSAGGLNLVGAILTDVELVTNLQVVGNAPRAITAGPDGNIWITASNAGVDPALVGRITPGDVLTETIIPTTGDLNGIVTGPDGNLWFTDEGRNEIGRLAPDGSGLVKFPVPTAASGLDGLTVGVDGNLWFTERSANRVGRITPAGQVTELACLPTEASGPTSIAAAPDGALWLTLSAAGRLARLRLP